MSTRMWLSPLQALELASVLLSGIGVAVIIGHLDWQFVGNNAEPCANCASAAVLVAADSFTANVCTTMPLTDESVSSPVVTDMLVTDATLAYRHGLLVQSETMQGNADSWQRYPVRF